MALDWMGSPDEPNAEHNGNRFDIEQVGEAQWWAFMNDKPVGVYPSVERAKARLQDLSDDKEAPGS
ncbi:MAG: hypothetical protein AAF678_05640 [Pseudomonadota bacterium]